MFIYPPETTEETYAPFHFLQTPPYQIRPCFPVHDVGMGFKGSMIDYNKPAPALASNYNIYPGLRSPTEFYSYGTVNMNSFAIPEKSSNQPIMTRQKRHYNTGRKGKTNETKTVNMKHNYKNKKHRTPLPTEIRSENIIPSMAVHGGSRNIDSLTQYGNQHQMFPENHKKTSNTQWGAEWQDSMFVHETISPRTLSQTTPDLDHVKLERPEDYESAKFSHMPMTPNSNYSSSEVDRDEITTESSTAAASAQHHAETQLRVSPQISPFAPPVVQPLKPCVPSSPATANASATTTGTTGSTTSSTATLAGATTGTVTGTVSGASTGPVTGTSTSTVPGTISAIGSTGSTGSTGPAGPAGPAGRAGVSPPTPSRSVDLNHKKSRVIVHRPENAQIRELYDEKNLQIEGLTEAQYTKFCEVYKRQLESFFKSVTDDFNKQVKMVSPGDFKKIGIELVLFYLQNLSHDEILANAGIAKSEP